LKRTSTAIGFWFSAKPGSRNAGSQQLFFEDGSWVEYLQISRNPNLRSAALWGIFSPANRKKGFYTNRVPKKQEVRGNFVWGGSEFWSFLEYSRSKLKYQKPIAVDVFIKAYPIAPLSCRSNLAGRTFKVRLYLLHVKCRKETMKKRQQNSKHETGCILSEKKWKLYILQR
jgi:hypothetical protein